MTATTNRKYFEELLRTPLFFMERKCVRYEKRSRNCIETETHYSYRATQTEISASLSEDNIDNEILHLKYVLLIVDNEVENNQNESSDSVTFSFHIADPRHHDDWVIILNSLITRSQNPEDKFPYIFTLWFLNHSDWNIDQLRSAIGRYDIKVRPYILKWLQRICRCLSYRKQQQVGEAAGYFDFRYEIYFPAQIADALKYVSPKISGTDYNLFDLVDHIFGDSNKPYFDEDGNEIYCKIINTDSSNDFICLYKWFASDRSLGDYRLLKSLYSLVSSERQLKIIQRYFHDIRSGNASFDAELLEQFRDNKYSDFIRYRYCIDTPGCKINIGNQLLCDCILTLNETQGKSFQSFNGILDFAINRCDITNPKIDLGLEGFLPCCNGGAVHNDAFVGFIDYSVIIFLDERKFTPENLRKTIINLLESKGKKKSYFICKYDNSINPSDVSSKCLELSKSLKARKLDCMISATYEDRWIVSSKDSDWLALFADKAFGNSTGENIEINLSDTSVTKMKESIYSIASKYKNGDSESCIVRSKDINTIECKLLFEYSVPKAMRIYPQKEAYIGPKFDLFGIKESIQENSDNEIYLKEFRNKEASKVTERVVASLNTILGNSIYNGEYFETSYNKHLLEKLRRLYYFRKPDNAETKDCELSFLKSKTREGLSLFCAPKFAEVHNPATDLPFFWCRGNECFHNNLDKQCLQNNDSWEQYTLFHFAEITGFPKLHQVGGGYEPDGIISLFIVVANKALKMFGRLKCQTCGHLIYPVKRDNFDRNNYYSCINPTCQEYGKTVYLNYCYRCKRGLIDSRDTKQCPNGWYICPTCLSCCDDKQYERLAQRYVLSNLSIPNRIESKLGKGHNDKDRYFCPGCGSELEITHENSNCFSAYCKSCDNTFEVSDRNKFYHLHMWEK